MYPKPPKGQYKFIEKNSSNLHRTRMYENLKKIHHTDIYVVTIFKMSVNTAQVNKLQFSDLQGDPTREDNVVFEYINYCYLYSHVADGVVKHEYVCLSPSYTSADGEFRHRFVPFEQTTHIHEQKLCNRVEEIILEYVQDNQFQLYIEIFYDDPEVVAIVKHDLEQSRLPIKLYSLVYISELDSLGNGVQENHIHPIYNNVIIGKNSATIYKSLIDKFGTRAFTETRKQVSRLIVGGNITPLEIGQKIIPLNVSESRQINNTIYPSWNEIAIIKQTTQLVLSGICPAYSMFGDWFYIYPVKYTMFDNPHMYNRIINSDLTRRSVKHLRRAKRTLQSDVKTGLMTEYEASINSSINYAGKCIIMSDYAVCYTSEYVGRTIFDSKTFIGANYDIVYKTMYSDVDQFAKYMFDYIYALFCLNKFVNAIHGDLHLNNATLYKMWDLVQPHGDVVYNVDTRNYIFKNYGVVGCIIDFSRAVVFDLPHAETVSKRVRKIYSTYFARQYAEYKNEIKAYILGNFNTSIRVFSALDTFVFTKKLLVYIEQFRQQIHASHAVVEFILGINKHTEEILTTRLINAVRSQSSVEFANLEILHRAFKQYSGQISGNVSDYFSCCGSRPPPYSDDDVDKVRRLSGKLHNETSSNSDLAQSEQHIFTNLS